MHQECVHRKINVQNIKTQKIKKQGFVEIIYENKKQSAVRKGKKKKSIYKQHYVL